MGRHGSLVNAKLLVEHLKNRNHENDINFSDEVRIRFLAKTDKITFMPLK